MPRIYDIASLMQERHGAEQAFVLEKAERAKEKELERKARQKKNNRQVVSSPLLIVGAAIGVLYTKLIFYF
jgi:hypothetical protein